MKAQDRRSTDRRNARVTVQLDRRRQERRTGDRRKSVRVPLELWMEEVAGDEVYFRRTGNVSDGGVYFDRAIPHPLGTMVTLKFSLPGKQEMVVARGEVVNEKAEPQELGMRVKFVSVEGEGRARLREYIRGI